MVVGIVLVVSFVVKYGFFIFGFDVFCISCNIIGRDVFMNEFVVVVVFIERNECVVEILFFILVDVKLF